jgi:hypothetical protein
LSRAYRDHGLKSGVDSEIGSAAGGFWYVEADPMNTYRSACGTTARSIDRSSSGVKVRKSATASKRRCPRAAASASSSRTSATIVSTGSGSGRRPVLPRLSTVTAQPERTASCTHAALI